MAENQIQTHDFIPKDDYIYITSMHPNYTANVILQYRAVSQKRLT